MQAISVTELNFVLTDVANIVSGPNLAEGWGKKTLDKSLHKLEFEKTY